MTSPQLLQSPMIYSPTSLLQWDEATVHQFFRRIGLPNYEGAIYDQGITGDVLAVMDHASLLDLGMESIGHRLKILRAIWELKNEQGLELGDEDWRPDEGQMVGPRAAVDAVDKLKAVHTADLGALYDYIDKQQNGLQVNASSSSDGDDLRASSLEFNTDHGMPRWDDYSNGHSRGSDGDEGEPGPTTKANRRTSAIFPSSLASSTNSNSIPPLTSDSATFQDSFTPTTANATITFDSPASNIPEKPHHPRPAAIQAPPFSRLNSSGSITSPPPGALPVAAATPGSSSGQSKGSSLAPASAFSGPSLTPASSRSNATSASVDAKTQAKNAAHSAAKSFRVTLEDPCFKVLPAALKKYKINDDWKKYALFICFGTTGKSFFALLTMFELRRKPLLLFQKLKEGGQKPVFMLRHIRDVRSPIAVAQQKQLAKLGLPPTHPNSVLPRNKPVGESSSSPTKPSNLQPLAQGQLRRAGDDTTPNGAAFPELPSPGLREGESMAHSLPKSATTTGTLVDKDGNVQSVTYAVAIYPYIADRQDEFDVAVGATFVILSKTKGWYIVQKDPEGTGNIIPEHSRSGWVPAGCLLELSQPICAVCPSGEINSAYPGLSRLPPSAIVSSSYPGVVLMDYGPQGEDEVALREGEKVRVYKKYCHWSYTIKQDSGERGWVPAWFIGKLSGSDSAPTSAATPSTALLSGGSAGSNYTNEEDGDEGRD
ncbi:hypothetical protein TREMEDRAFT_72866 [Tremella mesenterica DSM 1558]|uniref:uncharacterized protein n=1 Tax=Tremella mesenterica (strain ATCC 24925 / CBS 8224 / DSM 1558 / NBRC 9311 / NRRL Y-6157 / RJB 2259-6 / UBC 559-6) TaxID=578456 RepID=UPI0003F49418|nr:uncharacterized protein TREMEDRAFT_72866 [Tremella mesenterica DSM 1558]EIW72759.1 hypothetical protein TREMEDRAFT_72866 [Tremella mesenterica DSM 1558]